MFDHFFLQRKKMSDEAAEKVSLLKIDTSQRRVAIAVDSESSRHVFDWAVANVLKKGRFFFLHLTCQLYAKNTIPCSHQNF